MTNYTLYAARNLDGSVRLFDAPPIRRIKSWAAQNSRTFEYLTISDKAFPDLRWEDGAKKVTLTLS